jgi:hypothetical protein
MKRNFMNYIKALVLLLGLIAAAAAAAGSLDSVSALTADADGSIKASSSAASSAKFTGKNGRVSVNGDLVQAREGVLTINGVSYGAVNEKSVVQYVVRDGEKILTVDGVPRKPAQ